MSNNQLLGRLLATIAVLQLALAADPLYAPSLLFNWTLRNVDAPLRLEQFTLASPNNPNSPAANGNNIADAKVSFVGSGISYNGHGSNWETTQDGLPKAAGYAYVTGDATWDSDNNKLFSPASDSVLWARSMPRFKDYQTTISAFVGNWTLTSVDVMTGMNSTAKSFAEVRTRTEKFVMDDGKLNPFYNLTGRWDVIQPSGPLPVHAKCMDDAVLRVDIPKGTGYITLNGTRSTASSNMYFVFRKNGDQSDTDTSVIDASFPSETEALLYMRPLDPSVSYVLIVTCVFTGTYGENGMTSMTFYEGNPGTNSGSSSSKSGSPSQSSAASPSGTWGSPSGSPSSSSNPGSGKSSFGVGAIVGIVVGVVVLLLIALLLFCCVRRRRRQNPPPPPPSAIPVYQSGGVVDTGTYVPPTPYQYQPPQPPPQPVVTYGGPKPEVSETASALPPTYDQQLKH